MYKKIINSILGPVKNTDNLNELMKKPHSENAFNDMPHYQDFEKGYTNQADLLFLPEDQGYKYLLVCVDDSTRLIDAEPIKSKITLNIVKAFKKIYSRKILTRPKHIELDAGSEFKGEINIYFKKLNIHVKYADTNRHRQQSLVESANHKLGKIIFMLQNQKELDSNQQNKEWVNDLRAIITHINEHIKETQPQPRKPLSDFPLITNYNGDMLNKGDHVRILLDHPIEVYNKKRLTGGFRAGDIRWTKEIYKILNVLLRPGFPPMYLVNNNKTTQYTKQQLQVVHHPVSQFV